nr:hypothetical protein [Rhodococcus sp. 2G]
MSGTDVCDGLAERLHRLRERALLHAGHCERTTGVEVQEVRQARDSDLFVLVVDRFLNVEQHTLHAEQLELLAIGETDAGGHAALEVRRQVAHVIDLDLVGGAGCGTDRHADAVAAGRGGLGTHELVLEDPVLVGRPQDRVALPLTGVRFVHVGDQSRDGDGESVRDGRGCGELSDGRLLRDRLETTVERDVDLRDRALRTGRELAQTDPSVLVELIDLLEEAVPVLQHQERLLQVTTPREASARARRRLVVRAFDPEPKVAGDELDDLVTGAVRVEMPSGAADRQTDRSQQGGGSAVLAAHPAEDVHRLGPLQLGDFLGVVPLLPLGSTTVYVSQFC